MGDEEKINDIEDDESSGAAAPAKSVNASKIIKILIWVVAAVVGFILVVIVSYQVARYVQNKSYQQAQDVIVAPPPPPLAHFDIDSFTVTTNDEEPHFAKITLSLGYEDNIALNTELIQRRIQIRHLINIILRGKKFEDINSIEDTISLSEEIKAQVNVILIAGKVKEVYFTEFVVN
ncbi:MAG: flagellar basal body-associated FliL family protein [Spirochaetes bacterium]|nr:flagellar basal body-associated FliL family protein [Spirochaetota bacterium]